MLTFIDESGHPHPKDSSTRPVLAAVCYAQADSRAISRQIFRLKRNLLGPDRAGLELKAHALLRESTFRRKPELRELVENVFDLIRNLPITTFAIVMERPLEVIPRSTDMLPRQYRYILQRTHAMLADKGGNSVVLMDGHGSQYGGLSNKFERYLHRYGEGQALTSVVDTPYFVDSKITIGIQLADLVAGVVRQYEENGLFGRPVTSPYFSAIARYHGIIAEKTLDLNDPSGRFLWHGLHRMPERLHYFAPEEDTETLVEGEEEEVTP